VANTLLTVQEIARKALLRLRNNLVLAQLVHREYTPEFGVKGDSITVRKPAVFTAAEFSTAISVQNVTESSVSVSLDKIADVSVEITSKQMKLNIADFGSQVLDGAMQAIAQKIDADGHALYKDIPYRFGTAGTTPDALEDIAGVRKVLQENKVPNSMRRLVIDPSAEAKLLVLDAVVGADKSGSTQALREANMGRLMGFDTYASQNVADHTRGAYGALTDVSATAAAGATSILLESTAGVSTAVLNKGDLFSTADGQVFTVTATSAAAVAGDVTVAVSPAVGTALTASAVTFVASHTANLAFHRNAFALVNVPLALPGGSDGYVTDFEGLSVRVVRDYDISAKKEVISFDVLYGWHTLYPELAARLLG